MKDQIIFDKYTTEIKALMRFQRWIVDHPELDKTLDKQSH